MRRLDICSNCERRIDSLEAGSAASIRDEKSETGSFDARLTGCLQICARADVIDGVNVMIDESPATVYTDKEGKRKIKKYV